MGEDGGCVTSSCSGRPGRSAPRPSTSSAPTPTGSGSSRSPPAAATPSCSRSQVAEFAPAYSGLGEDASTEAAALACDVVLNAINGAVGLRPTLAALDAGNMLALANKESLIVGGPLVIERAEPGQIVPVDSEHSALAQCLRGGRRRRCAGWS